MQENNINELFAIPTGLEPEIKIEGTTFYSSAKLKGNFLLAFAKSSKGKAVYKDIAKLVKSEKVVPCFKHKGVFKFIKRKLSGNKGNSYILAFYHIPTKKVIVLIDNSSTIFGTSSNNELASTTMHECMHLAAGRNLSKFVSIFLPRLREFYSEFFKDYLKIESVPKQEIDSFIKYISKYEIEGPSYANRDLANYYRFLEKTFFEHTKLKEDDFRERLTDYIVAVKLFIISFDTFVRNARKYSMLFSSLNAGYKNAFGKKNKYTTPIQELVSMSEVACVLSEMKPKDSYIKRIFRSIS
jgi:hypothetical protein